MALQTLFGDAAKVVGVVPAFNIIKISAGVDPEVVFNANAPAAFTVLDFQAWNNNPAAQAGGRAQLETGAGNVSDNLVISVDHGVARATTLDPAFTAILTTTVLTIDKDAAGTMFVARILANLT